MNSTCAVCTDCLSKEREICSVPCGHVFHRSCLLRWFNEKKSCPECRKPAREQETHRLYLHFENTNNGESSVDTYGLHEQINNLKYDLVLKEKDVEISKKMLTEVKAANESLRAKVLDIEKDRNRKNALIYCLKDQVSVLKASTKEKEKLCADIVELKSKLKQLESVDTALKASPQEVMHMVENEDVSSLRLLVVTLKKALAKSDQDKVDAQHKIRNLQVEMQRLQRRLGQSETVSCELNQKVNSLVRQLSSVQPSSVVDLTNEAKVQQPTQVAKVCKIKFPEYSRSHLAKIKCDKVVESGTLEPAQDDDSTDTETVETFKRNDGSHPKNSRSTQTLTGYKNPSSIFKKPKTTILENVTTFNRSEFLPDGLGGHAKEDIFPAPKILRSGIKREATDSGLHAKFRKLETKKN